jgi:hypothetical protein
LYQLVVTAFLTLLNIPRQPLVFRVGDVPLGGEPGGIDAGVLSIKDQPWLWYAKSSLPSLHSVPLQRLAGRQWKFDVLPSGFVDDEQLLRLITA